MEGEDRMNGIYCKPYHKTVWIFQMTDEDRKEVAEALMLAIIGMKEDNYLGYSPEFLLADGMASRLCNLEETIDISRWI